MSEKTKKYLFIGGAIVVLLLLAILGFFIGYLFSLGTTFYY